MILALILVLQSHSSFAFDLSEIGKAITSANCDKDAAYDAGMNDARNENDMNSAAYNSCGKDGAAAKKAYREGFQAGLKSGKRTEVVVVSAASARPRGCLEAYGRKECGYDCKEAYGKIRCGTSPEHNCVEAYGKIECGLNCRENFGRIECDEQ